MPATLVDAIRIAVNAHGEEPDLNGEPYVLHPLRVMLAQHNEEARIVAVLHDVVEDTSVTLDDLAREGFSETILKAVQLLTKDPELSYKENIARVKDHPLARAVKLADLQDNMDIRRIPEPTKHDLKRLKRYRAAWTVLMEAAREVQS
ncbi:MAG: HD domain-containing protein [Planctomycetaceae bacterium]|nr:HD domain-containing protein [Planctomycetaceae bacterium]